MASTGSVDAITETLMSHILTLYEANTVGLLCCIELCVICFVEH